MTRIKSPEDLKALQARLVEAKDRNRLSIHLCAGTGCNACGCQAVADAFRKKIAEEKLEEVVGLKLTGCRGFCERGPLAVIHPQGIFYQQIKPADVDLIFEQTIKHGQIVHKLLYRDPTTKKRIELEDDIPFYKKQMRLILGKNRMMDPNSIDDYIALGGYQSAAKALTAMSPEMVIEEIKASGLRGRGGGGFPAGKKWETCRNATGEPKYVICNADEGDPGAFMDRSVLEGNPHSVIEGMIIGAFAIGSHRGYVYVRHEYRLAVKNLRIALEQARARGLLGDNLFGSGFAFDIDVSRGGGAFVCGESTALMASLEGKIGEPRAKYVHTVEFGLWDKPSNLNNVETWANVPLILENGSAWFASIGTENSKGTKLFALTGRINNTGLVEVPMGITLREILHDIGGGVPGKKKFKAVQTGGPSGGTLIVETADEKIHRSMVRSGELAVDEAAESLLDLPIDFDELTKAGSMMGSGGMIVMDQDSCMVDVAKYFIHFLIEESCGKCLPCREGLRMLHSILERITQGEGEPGDIDTLQEIGNVLIDTSLCQLGGSAPNPVLSTIRYFRDEFDAHIHDKRCPAGVCKALVGYAISEACIGDGQCVAACPTTAISGEPKGLYRIDQAKCIQCDACYQVCKFDAIKRVKRMEADIVQDHARKQWVPVKERKAAATASAAADAASMSV
ncbi:MAG: NADH-ubiquinone oxidoreductase-F iron-sulfur binding region domain-containing protein [Candidatus Eisenbacteria bacterium]|nr:NADH-ubiquinone oxidoreductase-F iron-sulfur binding region domain-containing protein [Candidatus Eisenbacteria bacterium]